MDMAIMWVILGSFLEPVWVIGLKKYNETHSLFWGIFAVAFIIISPSMMSFSMNMGMSVGIAYSIWTGLGAVFTMIAGLVLFKEKVDRVRIFFVMLIIIGVVGLELSADVVL